METPTSELWQLPPQLRTLIEAELDGDEKITWVGMPIPSRVALKALPLVMFGIPWTAFALFWMCGASGFRAPDFKDAFDFFPLFGAS